MSTDVASNMLDGAENLPRQLFSESTPVVAANEIGQPAKGGRDFFRTFKEWKQQITNDWGGSKPPAEGLVKAQQDIGETMGELGLAFIKLTKFENEGSMYNFQKTREADMNCIATAAVKASRHYRALTSQIVKHLYLGMVLAADSAFLDRTSALLTVQSVILKLSSLQLRAEKPEVASSRMFGADRSRIRKVKESKETIRVTEDAKMVAAREYERIKENNRSALEMLNREKHQNLLSMIKGFVINQNQIPKLSNIWYSISFCNEMKFEIFCPVSRTDCTPIIEKSGYRKSTSIC
ncbi:hypothetical protein MKW94_010062 [Papaver nudicaule]|uniref:Uncharacterized protein n=1 Tax=Papaver nudicaule TaxID=74823 RepID=A0AA41V346_PAPNU|nr:hypothetical protein [Papaver nudicaule]